MTGSGHGWDWTIPPKRQWPDTLTGRRARGELEYTVDRWCKIWLIEAPERDCTPAWIARQIVAVERRAVSVPSIRRILSRWREIGYAVVADDPLRFVALTPEGIQLGYEELYRRADRIRGVSQPYSADEPE